MLVIIAADFQYMDENYNCQFLFKIIFK